ncbi:hypothetical protein [uncultured Kordia sp.]|nr:hypothetical protein [uncultured Kordia sp.]
MKKNKLIARAIPKTQMFSVKGGAEGSGETVKEKFKKADSGVRSDVNF